MNVKPTILQVLPSLASGGVERGTLDIARAIVATGWESLVASAGGPMVADLEAQGSTHITLQLASKNPVTMMRNVLRLERLIREQNVSLMHARSRAPGWSAWLAAQRTEIPLVTTFHGTYGLTPWFKPLYNSVMVRGNRVIAISEFIHEHIHTHYAANPSVIRVIPRGVDLEAFSPSVVTPERLMMLAGKWGVDRNVPLLFLPGRITRWKGQDVFVRALSLLPHRNFNAVMAGDDKGHRAYRSELEELVRDSGLEDRVFLVPHVTDMPTALALADIVVSASTEPEAFGRVPIEAQAMERPVIATDHGGARETVIHNETGWLCKSGSPEMMAKALGHVLELDKESRASIGRHGRLHVEGHFSMQQMQKKTLAVYRELLG